TLTFNKQELQKRFMFDIITNEHTFYLVAETEPDMNRWVQSICQICSFSQTKESIDTLRNFSSVSHNLCSSPAELSSSSQPLLRAGSVADSEDTFKAPSNTLCMEFEDPLVDSAIAPPPRHPKTPWWGSPQQRPPVSDYKYSTRGEETACWSAKSLEKTVVG
ncbi:GRB2-associated-binding protein 2, partial [Cricetulus griseus]